MLSSVSVEQDITTIASMKRTELKVRIRRFHGNFQMDFTESYLNSATEDHLRHILFAARVKNKRRN